MSTRRRAGSIQGTHEGADSIAGTHPRGRRRPEKARLDALAEAETAEGLPSGTDADLGTPMSDQQLDLRDRTQSAKRKSSGPTGPEMPTPAPVAPPPSAPPPTDPQ